MRKYKIGACTCCKYCGQDIQNFGNKQWLDRGSNRTCGPFIKNGEVVYPKTKHAPQKPL